MRNQKEVTLTLDEFDVMRNTIKAQEQTINAIRESKEAVIIDFRDHDSVWDIPKVPKVLNHEEWEKQLEEYNNLVQYCNENLGEKEKRVEELEEKIVELEKELKHKTRSWKLASESRDRYKEISDSYLSRLSAFKNATFWDWLLGRTKDY